MSFGITVASIGLPSVARPVGQVGLGTYRLRNDRTEDASVVLGALDAGCTLIDTASNYGNEVLIGRCVRARPNVEAVVVTKVGYGEVGPHALHPADLATQLEACLERLSFDTIPYVLLHNPEEQWSNESTAPSGEFELALAQALSWLGGLAHRQRIRGFGISTNTLVTGNSVQHMSVSRLVDLADSEHFCVLEFPWNMVESAATPAGTKSVFEQAHALGLACITNRSLHARTRRGTVRLTGTPGRRVSDAEIGLTLGAIRAAVDVASPECASSPLPALLQYFAVRRAEIRTTDAAEMLIEDLLRTNIRNVCVPANLPTAMRLVDRLRSQIRSEVLSQMSDETDAIARVLTEEGALDAADARPLEVKALEYPMRSGADAVLVGMRTAEHVKCCTPYFNLGPIPPVSQGPIEQHRRNGTQ
jgi:aryl-alcohol dehydrogenase-like predicted oxidoreductase